MNQLSRRDFAKGTALAAAATAWSGTSVLEAVVKKRHRFSNFIGMACIWFAPETMGRPLAE